MLITSKNALPGTSRIMSDHMSGHHGPAKLTVIIRVGTL